MTKKNKITIGTIIGSGCKIQGDLTVDGIAIINGKISGNLVATGFVRLAESAVVQGNLTAESAKIYGEVSGILKVKNRVELGKKSRLGGDLIAKRLRIEDGAFFDGKCDLLDDE